MPSSARRIGSNGFAAARLMVMGLGKVMFLGLSQLESVNASPIKHLLRITAEETPKEPEDPSLWLYLGIAVVLVLLGGAFAGLTIALMGQDGVYLQVIATSGEGKEQKHAQRVFRLLDRGKHWVLVTLLLSNVITNETLPIVLDRSLGGGWPAVLSSTVLIVIFGEVIPQAICVRYGLQIGAYMSPFVLVLMYIFGPIAWPTAKLLDRVLGEDQGTVYKKSGLKTLVTLHKTLGTSPSDRLNQDEVTIISAVLDLKDKPVGDIMTPMDDVFTMSADTVLDEKTMDNILSAGYSRIPIYEPGNRGNFVGMLLVKILITYDPEDCKRVSDFSLATLPETRPDTSCLDIVNFFQEGKSHMVLISEFPAEDYGALGVVTLEDVIEELIGEEIIDESDVYIDVHKAIRRMAPAPKTRIPRGRFVSDNQAASISGAEDHLIDLSEDSTTLEYPIRKGIVSASDRGNSPMRSKFVSMSDRGNSPVRFGSSPKTTFLMRRSSSMNDGSGGGSPQPPVSVRGNANDMREHLRHLGPSNLASRPRTTRYNTVKIKPGHVGAVDDGRGGASGGAGQTSIVEEPVAEQQHEQEPGPGVSERKSLLRNSNSTNAKDGIQALQQGYGSIGSGHGSGAASSSAWASPARPKIDLPVEATMPSSPGNGSGNGGGAQAFGSPSRAGSRPVTRHSSYSTNSNSNSNSNSNDTVGSLRSVINNNDDGRAVQRKKHVARSGSITENVIDSGGFRKIVLETTSSSSDVEPSNGSPTLSTARLTRNSSNNNRNSFLSFHSERTATGSGAGGSGGGGGGGEGGDGGDGEGEGGVGSDGGGGGEGSKSGKKKKKHKRKKKSGAKHEGGREGEGHAGNGEGS